MKSVEVGVSGVRVMIMMAGPMAWVCQDALC